MVRDGPRFDYYASLAAEDGVDLMSASQVVDKGPGKKRVYMVGVAPAFSLTEFKVKTGDEVQLVVTNLDAVEDLSHGMCVSKHDVNFLINPQDTKTMTFTAGPPGVYWYYCPWFCHALHLEMRGRMIVEA